jgi:ParB family chromosome partitioning protein
MPGKGDHKKMSKFNKLNKQQDKLKQMKSGEFSKSKTELETTDMLLKKYTNTNKGIEYIELTELEDAPKEWNNIFPKLPDGKMLELINSIQSNGLLNPIILWQQENKFMILSGHNRVRAFKYLVMQDEKYKTIPSIIFKKDDIDETQAREILIDTNYVQRINNPRTLAKIIYQKYCIIEKNKSMYRGQGRVRDIISKDYGLSSRSIEEYYKLNQLPEEIIKYIDLNMLGLKNAIKFKNLNNNQQLEIIELLKDKNMNKVLNKLPSTANYNDFINAINDKSEYIELRISIPKDYKDKFMNLYDNFLKEHS